jgi:hypothetical protein
MPESAQSSGIAPPSPWSITWNTVANHRLWPLLLLAIGSASSIIYPHPPFVAFAAIAGTTLRARTAIGVAMMIWLVNQFYGYTIRQYPWSLDSLLWGLMLGLGTLIVSALAALRPSFSQYTLKGHWGWLGAVALGGFVVFESLILGVDWLLTGGHTLTLAITRSILSNTIVWTTALALVHLLFAWLMVRARSASS